MIGIFEPLRPLATRQQRRAGTTHPLEETGGAEPGRLALVAQPAAYLTRSELPGVRDNGPIRAGLN